MLKSIKNFRKDEDGAVTVDWVVLTAAVVAMAAAAYNLIGDNVTAALTSVGGNLSTAIAGDTAAEPTGDDAAADANGG